MSARLLVLAALTAVYLLALGSVEALDVATGAVVSAAAMAAVRGWVRPAPPPLAELAPRVLAFPLFAAAVLADVVRGTWDTALRVCHLRPAASCVVELDMGERTRLGATVSSLTLLLSPGTVLIDLDWERRVMVVHAFGAEPEAIAEHLQRFYERWQRRVFP